MLCRNTHSKSILGFLDLLVARTGDKTLVLEFICDFVNCFSTIDGSDQRNTPYSKGFKVERTTDAGQLCKIGGDVLPFSKLRRSVYQLRYALLKYAERRSS